MSELRSIVESYRDETLAELAEARIDQDLAELHRAVETLELERLRRLAELERRGTWTRDGHLSVTAWYADRHRVAWPTARADVGLARALEQMPRVRAAASRAEVSLGAVRVLADAHRADPEAFVRAEDAFVTAAGTHPVGELRRLARGWVERRRADHASTDPDDALRARRHLHASVTFGGTVRVDGDLDPECGEALLIALGAVLDHEARSRTDEDTRTAAQRRADALGEICRGWLDRTDRPTVSGERPHLSVSIDLEALRLNGAAGLAAAPRDPDESNDPVLGGPRCELDRTGPIGAELARRLACDASVARVVLAGTSEPLDVGRRTAVVPPGLRRAVVARDRSCRFPGCGRPQSWCDAHHVVHWADGGPTSLPNLVLLCRRHHRLVHARGGFSLTLEDDRAVFRRPDGSVLGDRAGPEDRAPP